MGRPALEENKKRATRGYSLPGWMIKKIEDIAKRSRYNRSELVEIAVERQLSYLESLTGRPAPILEEEAEYERKTA
jgi:hypothetical protein